MEININSPSYYKNVYGIDSEIYLMCQEIYEYFKEKEYSDSIKTVGICPIVAPAEIIKQGKWNEETKYDIKANLVIIKRHIDFDLYVHGSIEEKKKLIIANVLKSINSVKKKAKINYSLFENDLLDLMSYKKEEIEEYL